jgi:ATP adenylyltransferase
MDERPLWAPWRIEYITGPKGDGCVFCAAAQTDAEESSLVVERGQRCFTMLNAFPYAPGHLMVVPRSHVDGLADLTDDEALELMQLARRAIVVLEEVMTPGGFNVGMNIGAVAGAGISDHVHLHVVPRWQGDTNFMPVLADTRTIPQALEATWELLSRSFRAMG